MNCLKCGFDLPENSKFCPKCGEKVVIPKKEEVKTDKSICEEITNHLEFLGYKVSKEELENENVQDKKYYFIARHQKLNNLLFHNISNSSVMFRVNLTTTKKESSEMLKYVNMANEKLLNCCKAFIKTGDDKKAQITFEIVYIGNYNKETFSDFFNEFVEDQKRFSAGDNFDKIFLD